MKKRLTFGVITAECYRKHTSEMMHGIIAQCTQADCNVIVLSSKNNFQEPVTSHNNHEYDLFQLVHASEFDGFLYDRNSFAHQGIRKQTDSLLKCTGKPVMLLDAGEVPYFENTVSRDSQTFELIVEHMIQVHGYKKIYCLTGPKKFIQSVERLEAYCYMTCIMMKAIMPTEISGVIILWHMHSVSSAVSFQNLRPWYVAMMSWLMH